jgi:DNA gyrase subunit B
MKENEDEEIEIVHLKFPDNVRRRPGMYIGGVDNADVILREVVDNSIDELFNCKSCDNIVSNKQGSWYVTSDNGRGIPIYITEEGMTATELACSSLHAGSKFDKTLSSASIGLNGVGIKATNALSVDFVILSKITKDNIESSIETIKEVSLRSKPYYYIRFNRGLKVDEGYVYYKDVESKFGFTFVEDASTVTSFIPDDTIFKSCDAKYPVRNMLYVRTVTDKFYGKKVHITLNDSEVNTDFTPYGMDFMKTIEINDGTRVKSANFYISFETDTNMGVTDVTGSINSLPVDMGVHLRYAKEAYSQALRNVYNIDHNYLLNGFKMNVIVMCGEVDFSSQTKERCVKLDDLTLNECMPGLIKEFTKVIKDNSELFDNHVARLNEYAASLTKISTINKIKSMIVMSEDEGNRVRSKIPTAVKDASSTERSKCELFVCEGKSAAGTILKARDRKYQGIIELRGVPMNAINADLDALLDNEEMKNIISAIGVGVNEHYNMSNPRYGKIIVSADADPDGLRIASLIVGMIARKMTFLIEKGMVYVLDSALYKQGNTYIYPGEESKLDRSKPFKRYKGLGEINVDEAKYMITNPTTRRLKQINLDDVENAITLLTSSFARKELMIESGILTDPYKLGIYI